MKKIFYVLNLIVLVLLTSLLINCKKDEASKNPPKADFTVDKQTPYAFETITFTDNSSNNPDTWYWEFPGGTPEQYWGRTATVTYFHKDKYTVRLKSFNKDGSGLVEKKGFISVIYKPGASLTDSRDSKTYKTIILQGQTWMAQNLDYAAPSGSLYYNNDNTNAAVYGRLYNWNAALTACPTGWHLPTDGDWSTMVTYVQGDAGLVGSYLKEPGTSHWTSPNTGDSNAVGFDAVPGGMSAIDGTFSGQGTNGYYWTSSRSGGISDISAMYRGFTNNKAAMEHSYFNKLSSLAIRCVKD
jgi:uncharacterized protein (TIGR02145 family)